MATLLSIYKEDLTGKGKKTLMRSPHDAGNIFYRKFSRFHFWLFCFLIFQQISSLVSQKLANGCPKQLHAHNGLCLSWEKKSNFSQCSYLVWNHNVHTRTKQANKQNTFDNIWSCCMLDHVVNSSWALWQHSGVSDNLSHHIPLENLWLEIPKIEPVTFCMPLGDGPSLLMYDCNVVSDNIVTKWPLQRHTWNFIVTGKKIQNKSSNITLARSPNLSWKIRFWIKAYQTDKKKFIYKQTQVK